MYFTKNLKMNKNFRYEQFEILLSKISILGIFPLCFCLLKEARHT